MIWNENALKVEKENAFVKPGGNCSGVADDWGAFKVFPETAVADALTLGNGAWRIAAPKRRFNVVPCS